MAQLSVKVIMGGGRRQQILPVTHPVAPMACSSGQVLVLTDAARSSNRLLFHRHNGSLANGDKGRRRSRLALYKRPKANGVRPDVIHNVSTPLVSKVRNTTHHHPCPARFSLRFVGSVLQNTGDDVSTPPRWSRCPCDLSQRDTEGQ